MSQKVWVALGWLIIIIISFGINAYLISLFFCNENFSTINSYSEFDSGEIIPLYNINGTLKVVD